MKPAPRKPILVPTRPTLPPGPIAVAGDPGRRWPAGTVVGRMTEETTAASPLTRAGGTPGLAYQPGLDGLRGVAVAAVLVFHAGLTIDGDLLAEGGFLGVSTFFTLSGFLITSLLLTERRATGGVALRRFWSRRLRRLMPAALTTLALAIAYGALVATDPGQLARLRGDLLAALFYVANWRFIFSEQSYADLFATPSPVLHFWSLAIEEQFYLFYPLVVAGVLGAARGSRRVFAITLVVLTALSVALMVGLHHGDVNLSRLYYGTGTRAAEMLVGALLGVWATSRRADLSPAASRIVGWCGAAALALTILAYGGADLTDTWLYEGGLFVFALLTAAVIAAAVQPHGIVRSALSFRPLRALGLISYGVYLYHWLVYLWLTPERTGLSEWGVFPLRLAVTLALATASYHYLEMPVRRRRLVVGRQGLVAVPTAFALIVSGALVVTADPPADPLAVLRTDIAAAPTLAPGEPSGPVKLLVVGDRYASDVAAGMARWGEETGSLEVRDLSGVPCGSSLTTFELEGNEYSTCSDWVEQWRPVVDDFDPDLVLVTTATWGLSDLFQAGGDGAPEPERPETPTWLRRRVDGALTLLGAGGARVAVAHFPQQFLPDGKRDISDDVLRLTEVVEDVTVTDGNVDLVAAASELPPYPGPTPAAGIPTTPGGDASEPPVGDTAPPPEAADPTLVAAWADQLADQLAPGLVEMGEAVRTQSTGVKIMVVGDSVSRSLGDGLEVWADEYGDVAVWNTGSNGCGIARGGELVDILGEIPDPEVCNGWHDRWTAQLEDFDPDLVVVLTGVWDLIDRRLPDSESATSVGDPAFDDYLTGEYIEAFDLLSSRGAEVVWLTAPCVGPILPGPLADNAALRPERTAYLNGTILPRLTEARPEVEVIDLFAKVCPDGQFTNELGGIPYARPDGLHFSSQSAPWVADWLGLRLLNSIGAGA